MCIFFHVTSSYSYTTVCIQHVAAAPEKLEELLFRKYDRCLHCVQPSAPLFMGTGIGQSLGVRQTRVLHLYPEVYRLTKNCGFIHNGARQCSGCGLYFSLAQ